MDKYSQAESLLKEALEINRTKSNEDPAELAITLNAIGKLNLCLENYDAAELASKEALELHRRTLRDGHKQTVDSINNLALVYVAQHRYKKAETLLEEALNNLRSTVGDMHPDYATCLNNLAVLYKDIGHYERAESLIRQALRIKEATLGKQHPNVANSLNNLAQVYEGMGKWGEVGSWYKQAAEIWEKSLGEEHPLVATALVNAGGFYVASIRAFHTAEDLLKKALRLLEANFGKTNLSIAVAKGHLARLYRYKGDYAMAGPLYHENLAIRRKVLGDMHPEVAACLHELAIYYAATGRSDEALNLEIEGFEIDNRRIGAIFEMSSESQRNAYVQQFRKKIDIFLSLVVKSLSNSPKALRAAFNVVLRSKGITAESLSIQRDALLSRLYPSLEPKIRQLAELRALIGRKTLAGPGREDPESYQRILTNWNTQCEELENYLARQIPEMNLEHRLREVDVERVADNLPQGSILVEFVQFEPFDFQNYKTWSPTYEEQKHYLAFVLRAGEAAGLQMIDLGNGKT